MKRTHIVQIEHDNIKHPQTYELSFDHDTGTWLANLQTARDIVSTWEFERADRVGAFLPGGTALIVSTLDARGNPTVGAWLPKDEWFQLAGFPFPAHVKVTTDTPKRIVPAPPPDGAALRRFGLHVASLLGSNTQWDSAADYLQTIADAGNEILGTRISDQNDEALALWRTLADQLDIEHDNDWRD